MRVMDGMLNCCFRGGGSRYAPKNGNGKKDDLTCAMLWARIEG